MATSRIFWSKIIIFFNLWKKLGMKMIARIAWRIFWSINKKKWWFSTKKLSKSPMLVIKFGSWWHQCPSSTSQTCHRHFSTPIFVTNIDIARRMVTRLMLEKPWLEKQKEKKCKISFRGLPGIGVLLNKWINHIQMVYPSLKPLFWILERLSFQDD